MGDWADDWTPDDPNEEKAGIMDNVNIKLPYSLKVIVEENLYQCPRGAEFFLDEHNIQWVKFFPVNGYHQGHEHIIRSNRVIIVKNA